MDLSIFESVLMDRQATSGRQGFLCTVLIVICESDATADRLVRYRLCDARVPRCFNYGYTMTKDAMSLDTIVCLHNGLRKEKHTCRRLAAVNTTNT